MKTIKVILMFLFMTMIAYAESNSTRCAEHNLSTTQVELEVVSKLSEFFGSAISENTGQIEHLLMIFAAMVTIFITIVSLFGYLNMKDISNKIEKNRQLIFDYTSDIDDKFSDYRKEIKQEIVEEVKQQIIYGLDEAILKVQEHAYKKVEHTVDSLTDEIQKRRFHYQNLIFKVNQSKKYEYEETMKQDIDLDTKIDKILMIQSKYNEINNSDIPKLFSKDINEKVIPTARKLSEYQDLKHIVRKLLVKALENDKLNYVETTQIKDILKECYDWKDEGKD